MLRNRTFHVSRRLALLGFACVLALAFGHALDPHHAESHDDVAPCALCSSLPGLLLCLVLVSGRVLPVFVERPQAVTGIFPFHREPWRLLPRRGPPCVSLS